MQRYLLEIAYNGRGFAGFQVQANALTVQGEIDKAAGILLRRPVLTTGASRTDAGVHAFQNYVHFDMESPLPPSFLYKMNALLPPGIAVRAIYRVNSDTHARFTALSRSYEYVIYTFKDPFLQGRGYYFPYKVRFEALQAAAALIRGRHDFTSFSKRNSQVKTFLCTILEACWQEGEGIYTFRVSANRFLRGMVRGLVGTMLRVGRGQLTMEGWEEVLAKRDCTLADFSVPPQGLFLKTVELPEEALKDRLF